MRSSVTSVSVHLLKPISLVFHQHFLNLGRKIKTCSESNKKSPEQDETVQSCFSIALNVLNLLRTVHKLSFQPTTVIVGDHDDCFDILCHWCAGWSGNFILDHTVNLIRVVNEYVDFKREMAVGKNENKSGMKSDSLDASLFSALQSASDVIFSVGFCWLRELEHAEVYFRWNRSYCKSTIQGRCEERILICLLILNWCCQNFLLAVETFLGEAGWFSPIMSWPVDRSSH